MGSTISERFGVSDVKGGSPRVLVGTLVANMVA